MFWIVSWLTSEQKIGPPRTMLSVNLQLNSGSGPLTPLRLTALVGLVWLMMQPWMTRFVGPREPVGSKSMDWSVTVASKWQLATMTWSTARWMPSPERLFSWNRQFSMRRRRTTLSAWSVPTRRTPSPKHARMMQRSMTRSSVPDSTSTPWDCSSGSVSPVRLPSMTRSLKTTRRQLLRRTKTCQSPVADVVSTSFTMDPGPSPRTMKSCTPFRSSDHRPPGTVTRETR